MALVLGSPVFDISLYIPDLRHKRRDAALREMAECARRCGVVRDVTLLDEILTLRERLGGTAVGKGVAIPHARSITVLESRVVIGRSARGIDWPAPDGEPVGIVALVLSTPETSEGSHHAFLSRIAAALRLQRQRQKVTEAADFEAVAAVLKDVFA